MLALSGDDCQQLVLRISFTQGTKSDESLLILSTERFVLSVLEDIAHRRQQLDQLVEVLRLLSKRLIDGGTEFVTVACPLGIHRSFHTLLARLRCDDRQAMLQADHIAQSLNGKTGEEEVIELPSGVQGGGVIDDVVMNVSPVDVSRHNEGVFALCPSHGGFIAYLIGFLRCNLTGLEGLPDLIGDHIVGLLPAGDVLILPLCQQKFLVSGFGVAFVGADELAVIRLFCVLRIVRAVGKTLSDGLAFADV